MRPRCVLWNKNGQTLLKAISFQGENEKRPNGSVAFLINAAVESRTTIQKITDPNIDCLKLIFNSVNVDDSLNVADSNKQLKNTAEMIFVLKYGCKLVHIRDSLSSADQSVRICQDAPEV